MSLTLKTVDRLCLIAVVLTTLFLGYHVARSGLEKERLFRQEQDRLARAMEEVRHADTRIRELEVSLRQTADELERIDRRIPENAELGEFIKQLDQAVRRRGVLLISVQPQPPIKEKLYQKIPIQLSCRGAFMNLYQLLQDLETADRLTTTQRLIMGKADQQGYCRLDLTALIFMRGAQVARP
jgi:Tfp pilus assembly protein PilO